MRYLKLFESFMVNLPNWLIDDIDSICSEYKITNYTINEDGTIDVNGDVNLSYKGLTELPLEFRNVTGNFSCHSNLLTSLEGCPKSVGGDFYCDNNPCYPIYEEWIDTDRRDELLDMMSDYDFLRGDVINWYLLEAFFGDAGLKIPNRKELEKYYTIED
jgi:hypothetical protein